MITNEESNHKGRIHHRYLIRHYEEKHPEMLKRKLDCADWFKTYLLETHTDKDQIPALLDEIFEKIIWAFCGKNRLMVAQKNSSNNPLFYCNHGKNSSNQLLKPVKATHITILIHTIIKKNTKKKIMAVLMKN